MFIEIFELYEELIYYYKFKKLKKQSELMSNHYKENRESSLSNATTFGVTSYKSKFGQELSTSLPHSQIKP